MRIYNINYPQQYPYVYGISVKPLTGTYTPVFSATDWDLSYFSWDQSTATWDESY